MTTSEPNTPTGGTDQGRTDGGPPPPAAMQEPPRRKQHGPVSRFFRSLFSHLLFAGIVVAGVLGYLYHAQILRDVGDTVCNDKALGQWMSHPPGTDVASRSAPTTLKSTSRSTTASVSAGRSTEGASGVSQAASPAETVATASGSAQAPAMASAPGGDAEPVTSAAASRSATPSSPAAIAQAPATAAAPTHPATTESAASAPAPASTASDASGAQTASEPASAPGTTPPTQETAAEAQTSGEPTSVAPTTGAQTSGGTSSTAPTSTAALTDAQPGQGAAAARASPPGRASNAGDDPAAQSRAQMYKAWTAAREAFAKRKPEAVTAYIDLAKRYPDVPELTGELGNIYFQQGKMAEAATQYYETAQRLIRRGEPGPAACLIDVMRYLDAEKAKALESQTGVPCPVQRTQRN